MTNQNKNLSVVFIGAIFFVFLLSIFSYTKINALIESAALVNHTTQVTLELEKVIGALKDAETGHRGYLLTHDNSFLEPFTKGLEEYPQHIEVVKQLTINNPKQQKTLATIKLLAQDREDYMRKMLEVDKSRAPTTAELLIGKSIMDSLRTEVNTMIALENNVRAQRLKEHYKQTRIAPAMLFSLSIIALVVLIISYWQLNKLLIQTKQLKAEAIKQVVEIEKSKEKQKSEKRFRDMVEQAPVAICVLRGENYIVEVANKKQLNLWGKTAEEVLDIPIFTAIPEGAGQGFEALLNDVFTTGKPFIAKELPTTLVRNGKEEIFYANFVYDPLYDSEHNIEGIISISTDVTELVLSRKTIEESEAMLKRQKRLYEAVTESTPDLIYVFDLNYRFTYANEALLKMWGRTWDESIGKYLLELGYEPAHAEMHEREIDQVIATKKPIRGETSFPHATLGKRIYDYIFVPVIDKDGKVEAIAGTTRDITQQVEARQIMEASEQRFKLAIAGSNQIVFSQDKNLKHTWIHNSHPDFKAEDIIGKTDEDIHVPSTAAILTAIKQQILDTGIAFNGDVEIEVSGQIINYTMHIEAIKDAAENITGIIGTAIDITENKQAEKALIANEEKLNIVIEASELGIWEIDLNTNDFNYSDKYLEIMGYPPKKIVTLEETEKLVHPDYIQAKEEAIKKSRETGLFYFVGKIIWEDHSIHWIESKARLFYDEQHHPLKILGTTEDITEEKQQQQILLESEQKFRLLADSMPQHIWTSDPQGNLNYYNQSVFDYSGLTLEQINKDGWIEIVHPEDREENIRQWFSAVSLGKDFLLEHRFRRYDGEYRWQLSRAIPQKDKNGNIQMWVGTSTDIQDQKTREEKKDEFISIASHEMKTPLTTAKAYLQLLELLLDESNENARLYAKKASQSVNRLNELISELLDVSKIRLGKLNYTITTFDFNELIKNTVDNVQLTSPTHTILKSGQVYDEITGDKDRLQQVIINLLSNAIKYSPGAEKVFITIAQEKDIIKVSVKDIGIGIAKQNLDKIFEKYHRVEEHAVKFQGLGIGLFISYEIIQRHCGKLWAESELGKGSTFHFTIPIKK